MGFLSDWLDRSVSDADLETIIAKTEQKLVFKELAFFIAKSYIANAISKCEFLVFENGKEVHNELYYALNVSPNHNQNSSQFLNKLINALYDDEKGALVIPKANRLYVADSFSIDKQPLKENIFAGVTVEEKQLEKRFKSSEVFHFQLDNKSVKKLIDGTNNTYSQLMTCAIAAYKRGNGQKYKLAMENQKAGDKVFAQQFNTTIKEQLKTFIESESAVYPQYRGTDLQLLSGGNDITSNDVIQIRKEQFEVVSQALKIPLPMMYGNITNMQEIVKVFLSFCIDPLADMLGEELTRKTNTFKTWNGGKNYVKVDTSRINHFDILDVADKADKLIASGTCSIDEVRRVLDMQLLETDFSQKHWITKNYSDVASSMQQEGVKE